MGILALKTQKKNAKIANESAFRVGALVVGTLLALLNENRFVFILHLARLRPAAKNAALWRFLNALFEPYN